MNNKQWIILSIVVFAVGVSFIIVNQVVYVSRYMAYTDAFTNWFHNRALNVTDTTPPAFETYGIGTNERIFSLFLGGAGSIMVFIGLIYPVVLLAAKAVRKAETKN